MRKLKLFLTLLMLMCIGVTQMWGGEVTISPTQALNDGGVDPITIACAKGDGSSAPAISSGQLRLYQAGSGKTTGNTITFSSEKTITSIVFTFANNMTASNGSFSEGSYDSESSTWTGSTTSLTLTVTGTTSGTRIYITEMVVTYDGGSTPPAEPFTVTLKDDNTELTEKSTGDGVTLPSRDGCDGYTFAGWTKTWTSAQSSWIATAPEIIPAGAYTPAADENLYPVYTKVEGGSGSASPTTKSMTSFDAISGNVDSDENISYAAAQGNAGTAPAVNNGEIRIYQNGGLLTISANNGKKLTEITIGSSMGTTVTYAIDGGDASSNQSISANGTFTLDDIEATSVVFTCTGTSKTTRLYLNNLSVTYSGGGSGSTTYYISEPDCSTPTPTPTCEKTVSVTKVTPVNGDFDISATDVCGDGDGGEVTISNIEPATGYTLDEVSVTVGTYNESTGKVTGITANTEITVTFKELPKYTVSFETGAGNPEQAAITEESYGAGITLPAGPTPKCKDDGWAFAGWAKAAVAEQTTTAPTLLSGTYNPEANNETLYAVYSKSEGGSSATTVTITPSEFTGDDPYTLVHDQSAYTITVNKNGGTKPAVNTTAGDARVYAKGTLVISNVSPMTELVFNISTQGKKRLAPITASVGSIAAQSLEDETVTWTGNATSVTFTVGESAEYGSDGSSKAGQLDFDNITATAASSTTYYLSAPSCCEKHAITIATGIENGSVEADLAEACEGTTVTLTFTPALNYHLSAWTLNGVAQDVNVNTFSMPAGAATISATFEQDACDPLATPVVTVSGKAYPYDAVKLAWTAIDNANLYKVYIYDAEENELEKDEAFEGVEYTIDLDLEASTTYKYSVQAISNTPAVHCPSVAATGTFATDALPTAHLKLIDAAGEHASSDDYTILTAFNLPNAAAVPQGCPKVFRGWDADENCNHAPAYAPGASFTFENTTGVTLHAVYAKEGAPAPVTYPIDFEANADTYTDWTLTNITSKQEDSGVNPHEGEYFGVTAGTATASLVTKEKIANPTSLTVFVSKKSTNTSASTWYAQVSEDGTNWTDVESVNGASMSKGAWVELSADLSAYSDVYVRVYYSGSTAVRCIDDLVLNAIGPKTYSEYSTECEACKAVSLVKAGEDQQKGNTFALKVGEDVVSSVQTCEAASVTIEPTVATGYQVSFAISELEGASLSENTISLAANAEGELTVTATFTQKNYVVTLAQNPAAGATLVGGKEDAHFGETINLSTDIPTGYEFINWTSESVEITNATSATEASFTMPDADVTVTANFGKVYTVSFNAGSDPITETAIGAGVELPAGPAPSEACVAAGWAFAGWAEAAVASETTDAQTLYTGEYHPTSDITLYAVYSRTESGDPVTSYVQVTELAQVNAGGEFIITNGDKYLPSAASSTSVSQADMVSVEVGVVTGTIVDAMKWNISVADGEGYVTVTSANGDYLYVASGSNNGLRVGATQDSWKFEEYTVDEVLGFAMQEKNYSRWCAVYTSGTDWRTYTAKDATNYKTNDGRLDLYKAVSAPTSTTYYWSAPECCTPHNVTIAAGIQHGSVVANPTSACEGATITVTLTPAEGYELASWTVDEEVQELTATTFTMPNKDVVVSATFSEIVTPAADATLKLMENGNEVTFAGNHKVDDVVTLPNELSDAAHACEGKVLKGWSTVEITTPVADKPSENFYELGDSYTIAAEEDILYAVFAEEGAGAETIISDVLDRDLTGVTGTSYSAWSGKTATSNAVYAGSTAGGNESIQMRSNKNADGLVTTATGGKARKVTVTWNSNTSSGRTIDIYGKSTAYTAATDLYATATQGTKLGSIVCGTSTELTIDADYEYIGIRSASGALYLTDITIDWGTAGDVTYSNYATSCVAPLANPTFSVEGGEYTEAQTIELSAAEGTIYYTLDGKNPTSASTQYEAPIVLNDCGTTTIKAIAISATNHSEVVSETYTLNIPLPENSELIPYAPAEAIAVFDGHCYSSELVYVKGVVKTSSGLNTQYGNYDNIVVVAAETTAPEFTFYHMYKGANKEHFDANDPVIAAGDTIVAYGELTKYNAIYEFKDGCYLIDRKAYNVPKQSIVNDLAGAYTLAEAINFLDNAAIYDLSGEVYVKGVATTAPNNFGTFNAHDPELENVFQFYNTDLNELTVGVNDTIIVKGLIKKVNANYRMEAGVVQQVTAYVAPVVPEFTVDPTAVAFGNVEQNASVDAIELNVELTAIANATVTLGGDNASMFSIDKETLTETGVVTVSVASTATIGNYAATITLHDVAEAAEDVVVNVTMNVTEVETRKIATITSFSSVSGDLNPSDITYAGYQGGAQNAPNASNKDNELRLYKYQTSTDFGGYVTIKAKTGCTIDQVVITVGGNANVGFSKNDAAIPTKESTPISLSTSNPFDSGTGLDADSIRVVNIDESNQFKIKTITVYYEGEPLAVHHYILGGTYETTFEQNTEFSYEGLTVTAAYDEQETITEAVTGFTVEADLSTAGAKKAEVMLNSVKIAEYDITVTPGKANPNLAYMPAEQIVPAAEVGAWVAPELSNTLNVAPITYSTNKAAVATVDENGVIALAGGYGTAVITASFEGDEDYIASEATYTITITEPVNKIAGKWMVAGAEDIKPGIKVIVVGEKSGTKYAMGAQNTNNRSAVAAQSIVADTLYAAEGTKTFILVDAGEGLYAFQANNGMYLYAASNSSNQMKEQATINGNATWSIAIANDGEATIQAQGTNSRNLMSMTPNGNNNPLFSCYNSKQSAIKLYVNRNQIDGSDDPANPAEVAINDNVVEDEIVANGNVVVTVNTDYIEEPKSYIAQNGATIIITGTNPVAKNVVVEDGSRIEASVPTTTPNVYFATTMGSTQTPGSASELDSVTNIILATGGEIIYDLTLGTSMKGIQADPNQWHAFTLPFAVDALNGIYDAETGAKLQNEVNYAIMDYHGDIRANGQYGWKKYRGILQPGVFYIMTVDGNTKTFRFKATQAGQMTQTTSMGYKAYNGSGDPSKDFGWNGIGNPSWVSGTVTVNVQVLDPYSYTYQPLTINTNITVSTPFFYNAGGDGTTGSVVMQSAGTGANYAPARTPANEIKNVAVSFGNEVFRDKIYISASEDALNEYEQDKDLVRMIMSNTPKVAQIFGNAYGMKLSMVNAPMSNDKAEYSLTLYAPAAGEYTIAVPELENAEVYLTKDGAIIWNLSMGAYTTEFAKGNNEGYGLLLIKKIPMTPTGYENIEAVEAGVQKVVVDQNVFILRGEKMYDVTGKMVK